jgi:hypothetical protein
MGKAIRTSVLVLLLTGSAQAGWIHTPVTSPPPPPPSVTQEEQTAEGEVPNSAAGSFTETVLTALESVLALL